MDTDIQVGNLVWFTFDGAVPRLGVVSAIGVTTTGYQILFGDKMYWIRPQHVSKYRAQ